MQINQKKYSIALAIFYLVIGILFIVIPFDVLIDIIFTMIGIGIVVLNIFPCVIYWLNVDKNKNALPSAILSTIAVVIGFVFIFWHHWVISIILGVWLIVLPIVRILQSLDKKE